MLKEISCEERDRIVRAGLDDGTLEVYAGATNSLGDGLVSTTWGERDGDREVLREEQQYAPGGWPRGDQIESCHHWLYDAEDAEDAEDGEDT